MGRFPQVLQAAAKNTDWSLPAVDISSLPIQGKYVTTLSGELHVFSELHAP